MAPAPPTAHASTPSIPRREKRLLASTPPPPSPSKGTERNTDIRPPPPSLYSPAHIRAAIRQILSTSHTHPTLRPTPSPSASPQPQPPTPIHCRRLHTFRPSFSFMRAQRRRRSSSTSSLALSPTTTREGGVSDGGCATLAVDGAGDGVAREEEGWGEDGGEPHPGRRVEYEGVGDDEEEGEDEVVLGRLAASFLEHYDHADGTTNDMFTFSAGNSTASPTQSRYYTDSSTQTDNGNGHPTSQPHSPRHPISPSPDPSPTPTSPSPSFSRENSSSSASSTSSTSSVSTCITHIRASIEYRESRSFQAGRPDYHIFKDEVQTGWALCGGDVLTSSTGT